MKRILVTGATGFIGRHAVAPLQSRGFEVHAVGRSGIETHDPGVIVHQADLFDRDAVKRVVGAARADHLLHLAWETEPGRFWRSPSNLDWVAASLHLVRDFVEAGGQRVVAAGTCAEYEWGSARLVEDVTPCAPATLYGIAKDGLQRVLAGYAKEVPFSFAWGRVFFLYGPDEKPGRLIGDALRSILAGRRFSSSHGRQRRDFMHVADVADAFAALTASNVEGRVNIASGTAVPIRDLLGEVARQTGREDLLDLGGRPLADSEPDIIEADVSRLRHEVGFQSRWYLARGVALLIEEARQSTVQPVLPDPSYIN